MILELALAGALPLACAHGASARNSGQNHSVCFVVGDSIALDIAHYAPQCAANARSGIGSTAIVARVRPAPLVVISAGSNDPGNPRLVRNLIEIRVRAGFSMVVWVTPINATAAAAVATVAQRAGDRTVAFVSARDHVHPQCPRCLAAAIFALGK
jgi:hypothetical protein